MEDKYLTSGPISLDLIAKHIARNGDDKAAGASSVFLGQVRADEVDGKKVKSIEYSAYSEMVTVEADKIREDILSQFDDVHSVQILHSTGIVNAGQISLMVIVAAGHRHHAISACDKTVELIKAKLPVWKKEIFEDDSHTWI